MIFYDFLNLCLFLKTRIFLPFKCVICEKQLFELRFSPQFCILLHLSRNFISIFFIAFKLEFFILDNFAQE